MKRLKNENKKLHPQKNKKNKKRKKERKIDRSKIKNHTNLKIKIDYAEKIISRSLKYHKI